MHSRPAMDMQQEQQFTARLRWPDLCVQLFLHAGALAGLGLVLAGQVDHRTTLAALVLVVASGFGITAGAHRLWSHKAYKAKRPLSLLLMFLFTITGQRDAFTWALDHRVHHKYSETNADPHDARRGFWFAHVGWLVLTPRPEVEKRRREVDVSDLLADPVVMWQRRLFVPLFALLAVALPVAPPVLLWAERPLVSFLVMFNLRFCTTLNIAFFVNSAAHMWGNKPYDKDISPSENALVSLAALGEGWHNYHHVFPWDYRTGELGRPLNPSTALIDLFARLGWAYERKAVPAELVRRRAKRTGDGSDHPGLWGWGDKDMPKDELLVCLNACEN